MDNTLPATRRSRRSVGAESPVEIAVDKENATIDVSSSAAAKAKKSRSKSMGPGGLDALKPGSGNRRASLAVPPRPPPRSILKPTFQPRPEISLSKQKDGKSSPRDLTEVTAAGTKVALRTEEEQQAAAREREERERREQEAMDSREARRKSLANRRVSFAAEATLHTFHDIEYIQDSTTSTDSSRRTSAAAPPSAPSTPGPANHDLSDPPSTPPEQVEDLPESPADQRGLHQRKNRRSSGLSSAPGGDDNTGGWSVNSSDSEDADGVVEVEEDSDSENSDEGTLMTVDEVTSASVASGRSAASSADSSGRLDEMLRQAHERARTQSLDYRHSPDEDVEAVPAIKGWGRKSLPAATKLPGASSVAPSAPAVSAADDPNEEMTEMDMEMTQAVGGIVRSASPQDAAADDEDMSMEVTRVYGGVIQTQPPAAGSTKPARKSLRRQSVASQASENGEATMELTTAMGGILSKPRLSDVSGTDANEEMSMELTTALGGVLGMSRFTASAAAASPVRSEADNSEMDLTATGGQILSKTPVTQGDDNESTVGMDITEPLGGILQSTGPDVRLAAKLVMEKEADEPYSLIEMKSPLRQQSPQRRVSTLQASAPAPEAESPGLSAFRGKGLRRSTVQQHSASPKRTPEKRSPLRQNAVASPLAATPTGRKSPLRKTGKSPSETPKGKVTDAATRPSLAASPPKSGTNTQLFRRDPTTGAVTPRVVLTPQRRRLSGLGADKPGLGSPKVTEMLNRRTSIGDSASPFVANGGRAVSFEDPRAMEEEIDRIFPDDEDKGKGRQNFEREGDGGEDEKDATLNLKEMIGSLSPKKNPLRGRKSLHVGSGSVLGKRPVELDEDDDDDDQDGIKRLKGHQGSPVKNVRLQSPPSKAETTTGRPTLSSRALLEPVAGNAAPPTLSPGGGKQASSPKGQGRFRRAENDTITATMTFDERRPVDEDDIARRADGRIHLQEFLNMTSIRFMELTTTKRRHTVAPSDLKDSTTADGKDDLSLERCVVAGACTVPMLELYQHSCRELKKYISEGRRIVREIETDTFEENPPLFREYLSASPDIRTIMDNQFKNVKTNARLQSKAMWYEWRMMLQEGLKEGLVKIAEGMIADGDSLMQQEQLLDSIVPGLVAHYEKLQKQHQDLETAAKELADCDPAEIEAARSDLMMLNDELAAKERRLEELQAELRDIESSTADLTRWKESCLEDIKAAEQIREECRGWTSTEVATLKAGVEALEARYGWAIAGTSGTTMTMTYRKNLKLVFDASALQSNKPNVSIELSYIGDQRERHPVPATPQIEFFVHLLRDHIRGALPLRAAKLLSLIGSGWDCATHVMDGIRLLDSTFPTTFHAASESRAELRSSILLAPLATKVEVVLALEDRSPPGGGALQIAVVPSARVIYGEHFNVAKLAEFLAARIPTTVSAEGAARAKNGGDLWSGAFVALQERLLARAKR